MSIINIEKLIQIAEKLMETDRRCPSCQSPGKLRFDPYTADTDTFDMSCGHCGAQFALDLNTLALKCLIP